MSASFSTNRIRIDALDVGEVTVRRACADRGTLSVFSVAAFTRIGAEAPLRVANLACPSCAPKEVGV